MRAGPPRAPRRKPAAEEKEGSLLQVLELDDFVFYSEFLSLQIGNCIHIGQGSVSFLIQGDLQVLVPVAQRLDTIVN